MKPFIVCEHADFGYENQDAVIDLSLAIYPGDYLCIVGANGSGKSTLIKGLLGLLTPTAGTMTVAGELKKGGIGYLPQQTAAQQDFPATVEEVVLSGALSRRGNLPFYSRKEKELALRSMDRLGVLGLEKKCYRELSGGQKQRVLIARALCATKHMLILDEPTTGLDPTTIQDFYRLVRELNRKDNITIVMVSHDIRNVILHADRILHMQQHILFLGTPKEYKKTAAGKVFLGAETEEEWE